MARKAKSAAVDVSPASPQEVREYLSNTTLPEGVTVAARGRLSTRAKEYFTEQTGRPVAVIERAAAEDAE